MPPKLSSFVFQVDPVTQARLEALFETAGIGKIAGESKPLADPEVRTFAAFTLPQCITPTHQTGIITVQYSDGGLNT